MNINVIDGLCDMVTKFSNPALQQYALSFIPLDLIKENTSIKMRKLQASFLEDKESNQGFGEGSAYLKIFLKELAYWFKSDFFKWVNQPVCANCGKDTKFIFRNEPESNIPPYSVEVFKCENCQKMAFFNRFRDPGILLSTRSGRCCEWAQVFTLMCIALGKRARYVWDITDHVWTEVYCDSEKRWIHCDACETAVDTPLMYELGWNKKLSYIIAIGVDDIQDVSWRYSCDHASLRNRRIQDIDVLLISKIVSKRNELLKRRSKPFKNYVLRTVLGELLELLVEPKREGDYDGRSSGSLEWRLARLETTLSAAASFTFSPTPQEVSSREFNLSYSTATDIYTRGPATLSGWDKLLHQCTNIFRKVELDWKQVYLARREGTDYGFIEWKFDFSPHKMHYIKIEFPFYLVGDGHIRSTLQLDGEEHFSFEDKNCMEINSLSNHQATFSVNLYGGDWQHSQLFRQPIGDKTPLFKVLIKLDE